MAETIISPNNIYKVVLPNGYILNVNKENPTVYNEQNGSGAINITSYQIPVEYVFDLDAELRDFANSIDKNINTQNLEVTTNGYAYSEFITDKRFWKIWAFFKNDHAVFGIIQL